MHIAQLLPELNQGGVERGTVELNRELVARGVESTVVSAGGSQAARIEADGGHHETCDLHSKNPLTVPVRVRHLRRILRKRAPDLVHLRSRVPAWIANFANRSLRLPLVSTVHGFNSVNAYSAIMTRADAVICVSSAIRDFVRTNYQTDEAKLHVIPRGVDLTVFDPAAVEPGAVAALRDEWALGDAPVIASVGRITPLKGHDLFLRALAKAREQRPTLRGLIVGGVAHGKETTNCELRNLAGELGLTDAVRFAGARTDLPAVYALTDAVVCATSIKPESFGRTAAEALALNTPVVAACHGGMLDIVVDGENGVFFPPGEPDACANAILRALELHPAAPPRTRIAERFSLDAMTESVLALYRAIASQP